MDNRQYKNYHSRYKRQIRHNNSEGYFFIKANICLGIIICVAAAISVENRLVSEGCQRLYSLLDTNSDIKGDSERLISALKGGNIYTFAGEKSEAELSDEIKAEIVKRSSAYKGNNKGAPQTNG